MSSMPTSSCYPPTPGSWGKPAELTSTESQTVKIAFSCVCSVFRSPQCLIHVGVTLTTHLRMCSFIGRVTTTGRRGAGPRPRLCPATLSAGASGLDTPRKPRLVFTLLTVREKSQECHSRYIEILRNSSASVYE